MTTLTVVMAACAVASGFLFGWIAHRHAEQSKLRSFISSIADKMNDLRAASLITASRRDSAKFYNDTEKVEELDKQLCTEANIFYAIQSHIVRWCVGNYEENPFKA